MKWPMINRQPLRTVTVPKFSGGVNMRDAVTLVNDNQLTDSLNVWYKDNILKTRPGLYTNENMKIITSFADEKVDSEFVGISAKNNGKIYEMFLYRNNNTTGLLWVSANDVIALPTLNEEISFVTNHRGNIYVYTKQCNVYLLNINYSFNDAVWNRVLEENYYVPTIATNCRATQLFPGFKDYRGDMVEGFNILGKYSYYRMIFDNLNPDLLNDGESPGMYPLIDYIDDCEGAKVTVYVTNKEGSRIKHEVIISGGYGTEGDFNVEDNLKLTVFGSAYVKPSGYFALESKDGTWLKLDDYKKNSIELIAPIFNNYPGVPNVICKMTKCEWFGGDSLGISGGNRLFVSGSTDSNKKNLLMWSGSNDPLYFPENCYAYVGDTNQRITAFGKQNESLIIFKEREIFYTQYKRNSGITAEDLINQTVVDYTASSVYFPMIQLHPNIGCDCPETVQLCRNRLVWTCSDGNVYTLMTQNQFSERNVFCLSDMIKRELKNNDLKKAYSADFDGHYFLFVKGNVYVMNYESYGYVNVSSYNKSEDAQLMIPWWKWKYDESVVAVGCCNMSETICLISYSKESNQFIGYVFDDELDIDLKDNGNSKINSMITTKIFDFGKPHNTKDVSLVNISFGDNKGKPIYVSFVTEKGNDCMKKKTFYSGSPGAYSADYIKNNSYRPNNQFVTRLGVKVQCEGNMSIDSISINYKIFGGVK